MADRALDRCLVVTFSGRDYRTVLYWCPGCREVHSAEIREGSRASPSWTFNGDPTSPTLQPSVHYTYRVCHHFVTDGRISFLNDSTHSLAGQAVPLPTLAEWDQDTLAFYRSGT